MLATKAAGRAALWCALALGFVACSHHAGGTTASTGPTTTVALTGPQPTPKPSAEAAVTALLTAEQQQDHAGSFLLLSVESRQDEFPNVDRWARRRNERAPVTAFRIEKGPKPGTVVARVEHKPGLDQFTGLSPARETQTFTTRQERGGFLVDGEPTIDPEYPADTGAPPAAATWAQALQACDQAKAAAQQAVDPLYGLSTGGASIASRLCHSSGPVTAGAVGRLAPGPASSDIVAAYDSDALEWARTVAVTSPAGAFHVVLAPIGDGWRVIGLAD